MPPFRIVDRLLSTNEEFQAGLEKFLERSFAEATVHFDRVANTNPSDDAAIIYRKRAADNMISGVADDWDGST